jgi:hypothetical protein
MARATPQSLTEKEQVLLAETQPERLRTMDEEALIALHTRVRRARDKFVQLHRREVAAQVDATRARGVASAVPRRSASKAEIFEGALARVSSSLARAARATAVRLRAERLGAARSASKRSTAARPKTPAPKKTTTARPRARKRPPIEARNAATKRAANARRQGRHDAR